MKTIRPWLYVTLIVVSVVALTAVLCSVLATVTSLGLWSIVLYWGPLVGVVILCFTKFKSTSLRGTAEAAAETLARELMNAKYMIERVSDGFNVRLDRSTGVAVRVKSNDQGCQVSYGLKTTPRGTAQMVVLVLIAPPIAFFLVIHRLSKTIRFGEGTLKDTAEHVRAQPFKRDKGVRELLTESLSEARRLSLEAYEVRRSDYEDMVLLSFVMGLFALLIAIIVALYIGGREGVPVDSAEALAAGAIAFVISTALSIYLVRRKFRPQLESLRSWKNALSAAFESEALPLTEDVTPSSSFELLAKASKELPTWVRIRRESMLAREPLWSMLMVYTIYVGFFVLLGGTIALWDGVVEGLTAIAIGAASISFGLTIYYVSARRRATEAQTLNANWRRRADEMATQIENLLGGAR